VQQGMSSITFELDPEIYYIHTHTHRDIHIHTVGINYIYTTVYPRGDARKKLQACFSYILHNGNVFSA
jgi:hypothetical protein